MVASCAKGRSSLSRKSMPEILKLDRVGESSQRHPTGTTAGWLVAQVPFRSVSTVLREKVSVWPLPVLLHLSLAWTW